ncbi:hypothetical protein [Goodfellowiella coeruleoviolacea]|uniref:Uncharacterized protein n=1 Tax=Goodfellowiella coeruleoviolacea TaxID=334858 RepID=A0AAE3KI01_9PSEU|nr:hypothetical protein [Goodfellowiella coeruleoviolacea]MCP2167437.1 hypothetical protein [Goodfellowiella coeruleoviolacea]
MTPTRSPRVRFEDRLLAELKQVVVERADLAPEPTAEATPTPTRPARRTPRLAVATGVGALGVAGAVVLPAVLGGTAAYAVEANADGTIHVEIKEIRDAAGLEAALEKAGIPAEVDFLPDGKTCAGPRFTPAQGGPLSLGVHGGPSAQALTFTLRLGDFQRDQTLVITAAGQQDLSRVDVGVAQGPVAPCQEVDAPPPPPRQPDPSSGPHLDSGTGETLTTEVRPTS